MAFDTIYAEGQRRYVESLSTYARQFLDIMDKPDVDVIEGLSPAISIQQKTVNKNPRSTVGTITEIYDYLRLLYAKIGISHCTKCKRVISNQSIDKICDAILTNYCNKRISILAPIIKQKKGIHEKILNDCKKNGYIRIRINKNIIELDNEIKLDKQKKHDIEIVTDRIIVNKSRRSRLFEAIQSSLKITNGTVLILTEKSEKLFSQNNSCPYCSITIGELEPRTFSFNSPLGSCIYCNGLGIKLELDIDLVIPNKNKSIYEGAIAPWRGRFSSFKRHSLYILCKKIGVDLTIPFNMINNEYVKIIMYGTNIQNKKKFQLEENYEYEGVLNNLQKTFRETESESKREWLKQFMNDSVCSICNGKRLKKESLAVTVNDKNIIEVCDLSIASCHKFFNTLTLSKTEECITSNIIKEIQSRLRFLINVGLNYLTLNRASATLSGGEAQRIRLATQIGSNLTGVLYVLDEPTIGLHQRDNMRLIKSLINLRDIGNTVIVVEHDREIICNSDWIIDLGPGAGIYGGDIIFCGKFNDLCNDRNSLTSAYIQHHKKIELENKIRNKKGEIKIIGAKANNLKKINVRLPLGSLIAITGVSGSGKSSLINCVLLNAINSYFYKKKSLQNYEKIQGMNEIDKMIAIDQSPIGRTPRSNPSTYTGLFTPIRELYASTKISKERGYTPGQFSFNIIDGRCFMCDGTGVKKIEMQFLSDVYIKCDECNGKRYNSETLSVTYKNKNIAEVLEMTVDEALCFFQNIPIIKKKLKTLYDVGLGYIKLGQSSITLSGGEAQRIKLATELSKKWTGRTLYIFDEPTTGLHFADIQKFMNIINQLVNLGNTVIIIEHNIDVIKNSDWIIDLGPDGGDDGGNIIATGTPKDIIKNEASYTGKYLKKEIEK